MGVVEVDVELRGTMPRRSRGGGGERGEGGEGGGERGEDGGEDGDEGEEEGGEEGEEEACELYLELLPHVPTVAPAPKAKGAAAEEEVEAAEEGAGPAAGPYACVTLAAPLRRVGGRRAASVHGLLTLSAAAARPWSAEAGRPVHSAAAPCCIHVCPCCSLVHSAAAHCCIPVLRPRCSSVHTGCNPAHRGCNHPCAQAPALYTLLLTLRRASDGAVLEVIRTHCGLRTAEVRRGRLRVNGRAVTLRGVNRHEHDACTGHVIREVRRLVRTTVSRPVPLSAPRCATLCHAPCHPVPWWPACREGTL